MAANYDTLEAGRTGLVNPGTHCYLLSVCQALAHTDPLRDFLIDEEIEFSINFRGGRTRGMVTYNFALLIRQMWSNKFTSLRTKGRLKQEMGKANDVFADERQQDASELLISLIEIIVQDFSRPIVTIDAGINDDNIFAMAASKWAEFRAEHESPIADIFHFQTVMTTRCRNSRCRKAKYTFEIHSYQLVPINGNSLQACLAKFYGSEITPVPKTCDFCDRKDFVEEDLKIWSFPKILICILSREIHRYNTKTRQMDVSKNNDFIDYPDRNFDTRAYCHPQNFKNDAFYDLYAVVNHLGNNFNSGHYLSIAKRSHNSEAGWRQFNDNEVKDVRSSSTRIVNKNAYILFYRLRGSQQ